jgi:hypothetical protein
LKEKESGNPKKEEKMGRGRLIVHYSVPENLEKSRFSGTYSRPCRENDGDDSKPLNNVL